MSEYEIEERIKAYEEEWKAIFKQWRSTNSDEDRLKHDRNLEDKCEQIEKLRKQHPFLQYRKEIVRAYKNCCPEGYEIYVPETTLGIIFGLYDISPIGGITAISRFSYLIFTSSTIPESFRQDWQEKIKKSDRNLLKQKYATDEESDHYRLMVTFKNSKKTRDSYNLEYSLRKDPDCRDYDDRTEDLTQYIKNPPSIRESYTEAEVHPFLQELLEACGESVNIDRMILELFLPNELMHIDLSSITRKIAKFSSKFQLNLRFQNRQEIGFRVKLGQWKSNWKTLVSNQSQYKNVCALWEGCKKIFILSIDAISDGDSVCLGSLYAGNIGDDQYELWLNTVSENTIPTAVRVSNPQFDYKSEILEKNTNELVSLFPQMRRNFETHHYIHLIWDNPYRMFPTSPLRSVSE